MDGDVTAPATTLTPRELRKRITAASRARRPARTLPRPLPPTGIATAYTSLLLRLSRAMDAAIMKALATTLRTDSVTRTDAPADGSPGGGPDPEEIGRLIRDIAAQLDRLAGGAALRRGIDDIAGRTGKYSREQWQAQLQKSLGVDLSKTPDLGPAIARFRKRQTTLITSLSQDKVSRVKRVLTESQGARVEQIQQRIVESVGATESRAALIARTEVMTLNAQTAQAQHEAAGILSYTWSTSRDERVRSTHAALEGKTFTYASPPEIEGEGAHGPGEFPNCRCVAIGLVPGLEGI
jgi:SPP1 gp7 family putative phage head morphogenesis protein